MQKLVVIVGPTGVGKTPVSLDLAREFKGEIVNGDAAAMYRYLDVGSAKPSPQERAEVPHHLIDIAFPDESITVAEYQQLAYKTIDDILARGKLPLLVGGSGLYIRAVVAGYRFPLAPPDQKLRQALEQEAATRGHQGLYDRLLNIDPAAAARIDPRNVRRVIRAIEVYETTGRLISTFWGVREVRYDAVTIGLIRPLDDLYARIDRRVERMLREGLVDEVKRILEMGYSPACPALSAIGYKEVLSYLRGDIDLAAAAQKIRQATHRLARKQLGGWFRIKDSQISWADASGADTIRDIRRLLELRGVTSPADR